MTKLDVMLWNQDKTESVRASKIRSFRVYARPVYSVTAQDYISRFELLGWFNANESFYFGDWETKQQAQMFLADLHKQIEGR